MRRIIFAALVGVLVNGPVWGQEQAYICSNMRGVSLTLEVGKPKFFEDGFTGTDYVVSIRNNSATVTWKGVAGITDKATVLHMKDDKSRVSFLSVWPDVVRLFTLTKTSKAIFLSMTEHQITTVDVLPKPLFDIVPQARSFIATCR